MLANPGMRVALQTVHLPLREVPDTDHRGGAHRPPRISTRPTGHASASPNRPSRCGLNPHAGEDGHRPRGTRRSSDLPCAPARRRDAPGRPAAGRYRLPASQARGFDAVLAMYHDQGRRCSSTPTSRMRSTSPRAALPSGRGRPRHRARPRHRHRRSVQPVRAPSAPRARLATHGRAAGAGAVSQPSALPMRPDSPQVCDPKALGRNFPAREGRDLRRSCGDRPEAGRRWSWRSAGPGALTFPLLQAAWRPDRGSSSTATCIAPLHGEGATARGSAPGRGRRRSTSIPARSPPSCARRRPHRLVGNLPYNLSSPILFHALDHAGAIRDMHFMLQKEVVERMAAGPAARSTGA